MAWFKRNLILVVGGVVALVLLGASGFFLYTSYDKNAKISQELEGEASEFGRLNSSNPSVTEDNIEAAKTEQERLKAMVQEYWKYFAPVAQYTNITSAEFTFLLANTLNELNVLAENQGVRRPKDFAYTFDTQRERMNFAPSEVLPWTYQLLEIKSLCETIYSARVHSILRILRPAVSTNDNAQVTLRGAVMTTNNVVKAVTTPYEVTFQGFSSELATVLEGLAKSPQCFLIKNINVEKSPQSAPADQSGMMSRYGAMAPAAAAPAAVPQNLADRYGMANRYGGAGGGGMTAEQQMMNRYGVRPGGGRVTPTPTAPAPTYYAPVASAARKGPETVLDEQLLRFTLRVEAVRPLVAAN